MQNSFDPDTLFNFDTLSDLVVSSDLDARSNLKSLASLTPLLPDHWLAEHPESQLQIRTTEANTKSALAAHVEPAAARPSTAPTKTANNPAPLATLTLVRSQWILYGRKHCRICDGRIESDIADVQLVKQTGLIELR
jgi:hypothetical protein